MAEALFQFTRFDYSTLPSPGRKVAGPPSVTIRSNGQLAFNSAASRLFDPKAEYARLHTAAIPKGSKATKPPGFGIQGLVTPDADEIAPSLCRGAKSANPSVTLSLKTYLREVMKWDTATVGNVTLPVAMQGSLVVVALPATPPAANPVVPRQRKPKEKAPESQPAPQAGTGEIEF